MSGALLNSRHISSSDPHKCLERDSCTPIFQIRTEVYVSLKAGKSNPTIWLLRVTQNILVSGWEGLEQRWGVEGEEASSWQVMVSKTTELSPWIWLGGAMGLNSRVGQSDLQINCFNQSDPCTQLKHKGQRVSKTYQQRQPGSPSAPGSFLKALTSNHSWIQLWKSYKRWLIFPATHSDYFLLSVLRVSQLNLLIFNFGNLPLLFQRLFFYSIVLHSLLFLVLGM